MDRKGDSPNQIVNRAFARFAEMSSATSFGLRSPRMVEGRFSALVIEFTFEAY